MVKRVDPEYLQGPIPGMSLTTELGSRPWENPPVYPTVEEAISFYTEQILDPDTEDFIVEVLTKGISVEAASDQIISSGVMNGMHTIDVGFLIDPVIRELIMYVADLTGIDYVESYDKVEKEKRIPLSVARRIVEEIFSEEPEPMPEAVPASAGLMARRPAPAAVPPMPPMPTEQGMMEEPMPTGETEMQGGIA